MNVYDLPAHLINPARLAALRDVALLDTPTEESFDRLTWLAVQFLAAPIALVSLVDADRQFFKSCIGLPEPWNSIRETPLSHSFCQHNRIANQPLLIEDARINPLFKDSLATRDLNVIAYLGIPLVMPDGYVLGSFCVIDTKPRHWTEKDVEVIRNLAFAVMTEIQLRTEIKARHKSEEARDILAELNTKLLAEMSTRVEAEVALRASEGLLQTLVQTIPDLIWLKDKDGVYLSCNSAFGRLCHHQVEDILGTTDYSLFDGELAALFAQNDHKVLATGQSAKNEEWVIFADDGNRILLETIRTPVYEETGKIIGVLGIGRDITERKQSEEALARIKNLLSETEKIGKVGGWEFNIDTGQQVWTEEIFNIHEVDLDYIPTVEKGINFYEPEARPVIEQCVQRAIEFGEPFDVELGLITAKGNSRIVHAMGRADLAHRRIHGFFQDITERKRTEAELKSSLQMADDIVRNIPFGMLIYQYIEPDKLYLKSGNPEAERITGARIADLFGREFSESWPGAEESGLTKAYLDVMRTGRMFKTDELYYKDDKLEGSFHICAFRLPNNLLAISFEDISKRKNAVENLRKSEEKFRTVANYIHDWEYWKAPDGSLVYVSPSCERITGYSADEFYREPGLLTSIIHPDDLRSFHQHVLDIEAGNAKEAYQILEFRILTRNGEERAIEHICTKVFNQEGNSLGRRVSNRDVTERKKSDITQQVSAERLTQAVRVGNIGIFDHDHTTDTYYWSSELLQIYGLDKAPSLIEYLDMIHAEDRERISVAVRRAHDPAGDGLFDVEFRGTRRDGMIRWISTRSKTHFEGEGDARRPVRTIGAVRDITAERRSLDALKQEKVYAEKLIESANAMIVVLDDKGRVKVFNKAAEEITGYTRHEILEHNWFEVLVPRNKYPDVYDMFHKASNNRLLKRFENFIVTKSGEERFISWQNTELYENGAFSGSISYGIDLTERKRAEKELQQSEARFRTLVQTIPDLIWLKDKDGIYLGCNRVFERLFGTREVDIIGKTDYDFVDRELADFFRAHDKKAIAAGKPSSNEEWVTFSDNGQRALLETIKTPLHDDRGNLVGVLGIGRDITERKRNEEALQNYAFLMKEMGKAAKIGGWEFDVATGEGTWTEEVSSIHEVDPQEPTNVEKGINFYTEKSKEAISKAIKDAIETKKPYALELELVTAKGNHKWVKTIGHPVIANNKVIKMRGSFQDITENIQADKEREKLHLQLTQAQKMESVGRLAGGVAHDFNNMLGVILGYAEIALEQVEENQTIYSAIKEIQRAAQRSADLTRQLLAFARKQTVVPRVLDMNTAVESMLSMLRRLIGEDIDLIWLPGKKPGLVKMDPSQIDQILANLCVNARDAISDNGKVTVETDIVEISESFQAQHFGFQRGNYVLLTVSDNGCGMNQETQKKLFEPFFTTKALGKGTGLGLASVYGIVKQNNGFINVYSELGLGTAFKIYLPKHESEGEYLNKTDLANPAVHGTETVLLVEDELAILKMTAKMLEQLGYNVLKTNIPSEAIKIARAHAGKIQLLISDVVMPGMNGRVLVKSILLTNPGIKCLFMSGYTSNVIAHHGVLDKGVVFLQKPFTKQDLAAKTREALG